MSPNDIMVVFLWFPFFLCTYFPNVKVFGLCSLRKAWPAFQKLTEFHWWFAGRTIHVIFFILLQENSYLSCHYNAGKESHCKEKGENVCLLLTFRFHLYLRLLGPQEHKHQTHCFELFKVTVDAHSKKRNFLTNWDVEVIQVAGCSLPNEDFCSNN